MTVEKNVSYPLRMLHLQAKERENRTQNALDTVHLGDFSKRKPHELSGGQQQRVALTRCLTQNPQIVLMTFRKVVLERNKDRGTDIGKVQSRQ